MFALKITVLLLTDDRTQNSKHCSSDFIRHSEWNGVASTILKPLYRSKQGFNSKKFQITVFMNEKSLLTIWANSRNY